MTATETATRGTRAPGTTMKAAAIDRFGPPSVIKLHTLPIPRLGPHDVLIALHSAGVGVWDAGLRRGRWASGKERFPLVLGADGAGIVADRGPRVRRFKVDDRVWAYEFANAKGGFYAEYVAVNADSVGHAPRSLDLLQAGAAAVTGLTAYEGIGHLRLAEGETVLIFGATGAVGTLAIQFARHRGARVVATATGSDASALAKRLGAEDVVDSRNSDCVHRLQALAPEGIDAVLALAGGDDFERCLAVVRHGGRVAYPHGVDPEPRPRRYVRAHAYDAVADPRRFADLGALTDEIRLKVPIAAHYPLAEADRAHQRLEQGRVLGRIVLEVAGGGKADRR